MACSDVRERFHYAILLFMVGVRNMAEFNWDLGYLFSFFFLKRAKTKTIIILTTNFRPTNRIVANGCKYISI
jgi:hypothetical protein